MPKHDDDQAENDASSPNREYAVGYRKPPVETRFKPGQSGNPKGRPRMDPLTKKSLSPRKFLEIAYEEANRLVSITEAGKHLEMPFVRAFIRQLGNNAMKNAKLVTPFINLLLAAEKAQPETELLDLSRLTTGELVTMRDLHAKALGVTELDKKR